MILELIVLIVVLAADMLTKYLLVPYIETMGGTAPFIPGVIGFENVENTGIAWGLFDNSQLLIIILTSVVAVLLVVFMYKTRTAKSALFKVSLAMIFGGALGNLYDRIVLGYVRDFIKFEFVEFPRFNIADSCITIGAVLLLVYLLFLSKDEPLFKDKKKASETVTTIDGRDDGKGGEPTDGDSPRE